MRGKMQELELELGLERATGMNEDGPEGAEPALACSSAGAGASETRGRNKGRVGRKKRYKKWTRMRSARKEVVSQMMVNGTLRRG